MNTACKPKQQTITIEPIPDAVILCLHDIGREGRYAISEKDFGLLLGELAAYRVVSLHDWLKRRYPEDQRRRIVLTFDDGYRAHREIVLPELRRRGMGATFFFYADQLKADAGWRRLLPALEDTFSFGSHSWSHALLRDIGYDQLFRELFLARQYMQTLSGKPVDAFAWPYGYYESEGIRAAAAAGFTVQLSVDYRIATAADAALVLPRYTIFGRRSVEQLKEILKRFEAKKPEKPDRVPRQQ